MNYDNQYNDEEPTSFYPLYNPQEGVGGFKSGVNLELKA